MRDCLYIVSSPSDIYRKWLLVHLHLAPQAGLASPNPTTSHHHHHSPPHHNLKMTSPAFYIISVVGLALSLLLTSAILAHFLGIFPLLKDLSNNARRRRVKKPKAEQIELEDFSSLQRKAKERRRREEVQRRRVNEMRKDKGFYEDIGRAYRKAGARSEGIEEDARSR